MMRAGCPGILLLLKGGAEGGFLEVYPLQVIYPGLLIHDYGIKTRRTQLEVCEHLQSDHRCIYPVAEDAYGLVLCWNHF